ncbi:FPR2 [Symbiodinium sp. CCMP2456]|nr:FPR2 [Symbiodinium sp. CCMP2456]
MIRPTRGRGVLLIGLLLICPGISFMLPSQTCTSLGRRALLLGPLLLFPQAAFAARDGFTETSSGLQYKVLQEGSGESPRTGQMIAADYTGWLEDFESEKKFDSSRDRRQPLKFQVGIGKVIKGWDETLLDMKVGERRQIIVPPGLGYGNRAIGPIPAGSTLYFDVELKSVGGR